MNKTVLGSAFKKLVEDGPRKPLLLGPAAPPGPHLRASTTMTGHPAPPALPKFSLSLIHTPSWSTRLNLPSTRPNHTTLVRPHHCPRAF